MRDSEFEFIRSLVYEHSRINLGPEKRELVASRLGKRLRATKAPTLGDYCELLKEPRAEEELAHLIDAISTNHTFFFRECSHFDFLRKVAVPELTATLAPGVPFRIWSAACSTGEEPYSIAMTMADETIRCGWQITATDISHRVLREARLGVYREEMVQRLPPELVRQHFQRGFGPQEGKYRVKARLRERVTFHQLNLLDREPPFADSFHVIFCRNVMIYFDRATQEELIARLVRRLVPGGYLCVGHAESLSVIKHSLRSRGPAIYQRPTTS